MGNKAESRLPITWAMKIQNSSYQDKFGIYRSSRRRSCSEEFAKLTGEHLCWSLLFRKHARFRPAYLPKRGADAGVSLWILRDLSEHLLLKNTSLNCSFTSGKTAQQIKSPSLCDMVAILTFKNWNKLWITKLRITFHEFQSIFENIAKKTFPPL